MRKIAVVGSVLLVLFVLAWSFGCAKPAPTPAPAPKPTPAPAPAPAPAPKPTLAPTPAPAPAPTPGAQVYNLKYIAGFPRGTFWFKAAVSSWVEPLEKKSNGRLKFQVFADGELVAAIDNFKTLQKGGAEVGDDCWLWHAGEVPTASMTWMPMIYENPAEQAASFWEVQRAIYDKIYQSKYNMRVFNIFGPMNSTLFTNKPVKKLEDLKGMKIRAQGGAPSIALQGMGASAVSTALSEAIPGLQTGALDGVAWGDPYTLDMKLDKVLRYAIDQPLLVVHMNNFWNLDSWKKLPPDLQALVEEHARWANYNEGVVVAPQQIKEIRKKCVAAGITYYTVPDDEWARFREKGREAWDWFIKQSPECKQLMDATRAFLKK